MFKLQPQFLDSRHQTSSGAAFVKNIQGTWVFIMEEWFPTSGYEYAPNGVDFEYYREEMTEKGNVCDIYIPVVKK